MSDGSASVVLSEWQNANPKEHPELVGRNLDVGREAAEQLAKGGMLEVRELRQGLEVRTRSYVGRVQLGDLSLTVLPKIRGAPLMRLLRYAFGFRQLRLFADLMPELEHAGLQDLLVEQLCDEAEELMSRGLQRAYVRTAERLASPRGRIDISRISRDGGIASATLPCVHHPRIEDTPLNRVLLAGLRFAGSIATGVELRRKVRRLAARIEEQVATVRLDLATLEGAELRMSRMTHSYSPALTIIRLLLEGRGVALQGEAASVSVPGFMFDMNRFFETLLGRFLRDNLLDFDVRDQHVLKGMMRYSPRHNPQKQRPPRLRPDYVVMQAGKVVAILDAKYRDLWQTQLPQGMLYQLVVYALSQHQCPRSCILYPRVGGGASEARIDIADMLSGQPLGQVCLRPVDLLKIDRLLDDSSAAGGIERQRYARSFI